MEGYHIFLYIYNENTTSVVILEGKENMDPLFDSVTAVSINMKKFFLFFLFFYVLFRPSIRRGQFFYYTYLTSNHALAFCITPIVLFDRMFGCSQFLLYLVKTVTVNTVCVYWKP